MNPYATAESPRRSATGATPWFVAASVPPRVPADYCRPASLQSACRPTSEDTCASGSWGRCRSRTTARAGRRRRPEAAHAARGPARRRRARWCPPTGWSPRCGGTPRRPARRHRPARLRVAAARRARLRRATCSTARPGYRLSLDGATVDARRVRGAGRAPPGRGRRGRPRPRAGATSMPRWPCGAATRWPSSPTTSSPRPTAVRLTELRTAAASRTASRPCWSWVGRPRSVPELEALVRRHPSRERPAVALMRALYATGRQADALAAYHDLRAPSRRRARRRARRPGAGRSTSGSSRTTRRWPRRRRRATCRAGSADFVGRDREVDRVLDALRAGPLVTLTGVGGAGKTRLAVEVAAAGPGPVRRRGLAVRARRAARRRAGRARRRGGAADPAASRPVDRADRDRVPATADAAARRGQLRARPGARGRGWSPRSCSSARGSWCWPPAGRRSASTASSCGRCRRCRSTDATALFVQRARAASPDFRLDAGRGRRGRRDLRPARRAAAGHRARRGADAGDEPGRGRAAAGGRAAARRRARAGRAPPEPGRGDRVVLPAAARSRSSGCSATCRCSPAAPTCAAVHRVADAACDRGRRPRPAHRARRPVDGGGRERRRPLPLPGAGDAARVRPVAQPRPRAATRRSAGGTRAYYVELAERAAHGLQGPDERAWVDQALPDYDNLRAAFATRVRRRRHRPRAAAGRGRARAGAPADRVRGLRVGRATAGRRRPRPPAVRRRRRRRRPRRVEPRRVRPGPGPGPAGRGPSAARRAPRASPIPATCSPTSPSTRATSTSRCGTTRRRRSGPASTADPIRLVWTLVLRRGVPGGAPRAGARGRGRAGEPRGGRGDRQPDRAVRWRATRSGLVLKKSEPDRALTLFDEAARAGRVRAQLLVAGDRDDGGGSDPRGPRRPAWRPRARSSRCSTTGTGSATAPSSG